MAFWGNLLGYQVVWFAIVIGAGHGQPWPGILTALAFVAWQAWGAQRTLMLRLVVASVALGAAIDGMLAGSGLLAYASPWPSARWAPLWILAIWAAFAVTLPRSLAFLQGRPWLAAAFGAIGGPLAYLGAARGWSAVTFSMPMWQPVAALALAWALAMPLLASFARHCVRAASMPPALVPGARLR